MATFVIGDYQYTTLSPNTVKVVARSLTKSSYEDIPASVTYEGVEYSVTSTESCFENCTFLTQAPVIPSSVTDMKNCFFGCTSLTQAPVIPNSVTNLYSCFQNCTSLTQAPVIPSSVTDMALCFRGCTSLIGDVYIYYLDTRQSQMTYCFYGTTQPITLYAMNDNVEVCDLLATTANNGNVFVNIHSETPISFIDTQMNYMTNKGLKALSLQTNANLVQCEVPDLVNGGIITTNVNDALVDLLKR